jgi:hypothetical protein
LLEDGVLIMYESILFIGEVDLPSPLDDDDACDEGGWKSGELYCLLFRDGVRGLMLVTTSSSQLNH